MGLWWTKLNFQPPKNGCVEFEGDPKALSKSWPIIWRFHQNWAQLSIQTDFPYHLCFESDGVSMGYGQELRKNIVFVRIGPKPVKFWAIGVDSRLVEITFTGRWIQAPLREDRPEAYLPRNAEQFYRQNYPFI